jgi:integrase
MKLSDKTCKAAKPKEKQYKLFDGGGLFLLIRTNGSKLWQMKYRFYNKEKTLSFGAYPIVTLADAKQAREEAKKLLAQKPPVDPMAHKQKEQRDAILDTSNTFNAVSLEWLDVKGSDWTEKYKNKVIRNLEIHIYPDLSNRPIKDITPPELLACLRKIEKKGAFDTAGRSRQLCSQIFRFGIQTGRCEWNVAENLRGALKTAKTEHFRTIDIKILPAFLKALERNEARIYERTRRAVWLSLYTFCRPVEIRMARWEDISFEDKLWTIPAAMMKMRRPHIVPLCEQTLAILKAQKEETQHLNTQWVFPSQVKLKDPMSDGTVNQAIKRLGFGNDMVAHGFRALARTTIREKLGYNSEVIEKQLAHKSAGALGEAYDRTQFFDERKKMMEDWANFINRLENQSQVIKASFG